MTGCRRTPADRLAPALLRVDHVAARRAHVLVRASLAGAIVTTTLFMLGAVLLLMVYAIFAMTLYPLPPRVA
jgi:hypothetical protein